MGDHRAVGLTRERIVDAALEVGFDDLSMVAVARHLGVSGPALYYHFDNLGELIRAAVGRVIAMAPDPLANPRSISELVYSEAEAVIATIAAHPGIAEAGEKIATRPPEVDRRNAQLAERLRGLGIAQAAVPVVLGMMITVLFRNPPRADRDDGDEWVQQLDLKLRVLTAGFEALIDTEVSGPDAGR